MEMPYSLINKCTLYECHVRLEYISDVEGGGGENQEKIVLQKKNKSFVWHWSVSEKSDNIYSSKISLFLSVSLSPTSLFSPLNLFVVYVVGSITIFQSVSPSHILS